MTKTNKAHTATVNRIARRYHATTSHKEEDPDLQTDSLTIEVETTATLDDGVAKLKQRPGPVYLAVTNREALREALRKTENTRIGVMDPQGNIVKPSEG